MHRVGGVSLLQGRYAELGPIAAALGLPWTGGAELRFQRDGFAVTVGLRIDSGSVMGVDLVVHRPGWPDLELRDETDGDRRAKASGMNVEVQTGDADFDRRIYIESSYGQAVLGPMLASSELRRLLAELVSRYGPVSVTSEGLTVATHRVGRQLLAPAAFMALFEIVMRAAHALPALPANAPKVPERGFGIFVVAVLSVLAGFVALPAMRGLGAPESWLVRPLALLAGFVVAIALAPGIRMRARGHSRSAFWAGGAILAFAIGLPLVAMQAVLGINAAFDTSPPQRREARIVTAKNYLDDSEPKVDVALEWSDGRKEAMTLDDPRPQAARVGDRVDTVRRRGLLGIAWIEQPPKIVGAKR